MKKLLIAFCVVALPASMLLAETPAFNVAQGIKIRQDKMLKFYASTDAKHLSNTQIAAKLRLGLDIDRCRADFEYNLDNPSGEMFFALSMMTCYLYGYPYWNDAIHAKAKKVWQTYLPYRGDTENHWVMWHSGMLLAAQTWPDITFSNGRTAAENYKDAEEYLNSWFKRITTIGSGEFDSPCYLQAFMSPMLVVYDFVKDPVMKQKMEMAIDWMWSDYAIDYLHGAYTGGHSRCYDRDLLLPGREGGDAYGYIFFGDSQFPAKGDLTYAVIGALTSYKLPEIIQNVALDRNVPYVVEKRKSVRNVIRFFPDKNPPVYKENYVSRSFSVGCNDGGLQQPIQIHTWGITYFNNGSPDEVFALHPYYSELELGMSFPEKLKIMIGDVVKSKGSYNKEDKWTGGSPFEKMYQFKNAIIGLYDLDKDTPFKHIDYFFPNSLTKKEVDPSGWIFCQGGGAYIAIRPFKPGTWTEKEKVNPNQGIWSDDSICSRFRSPYLKNGYAAEAFEASDFKSWDDFKARMLTSKLDLSKLDSGVEVTYTTTNGDVMKFQFPDKRYLNGNAVDYKTMPLFRSPWVNGNDGIMNITYGKEQLTLDFNKSEIIKKVTN